MGSSRQITFLLMCLFVYSDVSSTFAQPGQLHEERREFQYQRSSKISSGGTGYYNSASGSYDNSNLDDWMNSHKDQVQGMAEKLRSEFDTSQVDRSSDSYAQTSNCNIQCATLPSFTGKTKEELDTIAKDMTSQIISDLQSGKLDRNQVNQPNWFEHRVAQKLEELNRQHQTQYQQNVYAASNRFRQNNGQDLYTPGGSVAYNREDDDNLQQSQQNIFNAEDLRQIQQTISNQQQFQHQGSFYQQQSQNQHSVYTSPVTRYRFVQTSSRDEQNVRQPPPPPRTYITTELESANRVNEERTHTVYPTPVVRTTNAREARNYTTSSSSGSTYVQPQVTTYNQYDRTDDEDDEGQVTQDIGQTTVDVDDSQYVHHTVPMPTQPTHHSTYESRNQYDETRRTTYPKPVTPPRTYHTSTTTVQEREQTTPYVTPPQHTVTASNTNTIDESRQISTRPIYTGGYDRHEQTNEYDRSRTNYIRPTQPTIYTTREQEDDQRTTIVEVHTPPPVAVPTQSKHSIYNHLSESDNVPNYRPRVVIDKNTEFRTLDHHQETDNRQHQVLIQRIEEQEYLERLNRLQDDLRQCGFGPFSQSEYNSTIKTGTFIRNGQKYLYNVNSGHYEKADQIETLDQTRYPSQTTQYNETSSSNSYQHHQTTDEHDVQQHVVQTLPTRKYVLELTEEEYRERLHQVQSELARLGYSALSEEIYNATIISGGFTHNGYKYLYNTNTRRFEKGQQEENVDEHQTHIQPEYPTDTYSHHYNENVQTHTRRVQPLHRRVHEQFTDEQYMERLQKLRNELVRLGYGRFTDDVYNETIASGGFNHDGYKYTYNVAKGRYEQNGRLDVTDEEVYENVHRELERKLHEIGFAQMNNQEINQTLSTGVFIRGGCRYTYNAGTEQYEKFEITAEEKQKIFLRIQEILKRFGYRQISQRENEALLQSGSLIRGGYRWIYESQRGTLEKNEYVGDFAELSTDEYTQIYRRIQETIRKLGYGQMTQQQCNATITSGTFERGGIHWTFNAETGRFERVELSQNEYRDRLNLLRHELTRIGHRDLSPEEYRAIVYRGYFHHGGYRYEYNSDTGRFEQIELSEAEYAERLRRLQDQLRRIGYGQMSVTDCNTTISNGVFYYGGYEWLYNFDTGVYDKGDRSSKEQSIDLSRIPNTQGLDQTRYDSTQDKNNKTGIIRPGSTRPRPAIISKDRGDQPPQHFNEDYESEEILEQEPGLGFYAANVKPEIGLAPPGSFNQMQERTTPVVPPRREVEPVHRAPLAPYQTESERRKYESEHTVVQPVIPMGQQRSEYERRYHRTESSYVHGGLMPVQYATQHTLPDVYNEEAVGFTVDPIAFTTEVYTVGSNIDGPRQTTESYPKRRSSPEHTQHPTVPQNLDKLEDLGQTLENVDGGQQVQTIDYGQRPEDLTQQLVGLNHESENLRQRQATEEFRRRQQTEEQQQRLEAEQFRRQQQVEEQRKRQEADDLRELQRTYDLQQHHQQTEDLRQHHETEDLRQHQQTEDLRQRQQTEDLRQHHENEDLRQHHETEDLRQHHETQDFRQYQQREDLTQQHETEDTVQRSSNSRQSTYSGNLSNANKVAQPNEEEATVVEVTTMPSGLWSRFKEKTKNLFG